MLRNFLVEYWNDAGWFVGRLKEVPGVFSQGASLEELQDNLRDAYYLMMNEDQVTLNYEVEVTEMEIDV